MRSSAALSVELSCYFRQGQSPRVCCGYIFSDKHHNGIGKAQPKARFSLSAMSFISRVPKYTGQALNSYIFTALVTTTQPYSDALGESYDSTVTTHIPATRDIDIKIGTTP